MLRRLTIDNYALIDHLDITFPGDLVIITGETGAGKSILLGALSLLLGGKADGSVVKDESRNCVVEGEFEDSGRELIIRRVLSSNGRSRSFVDDEPVALDSLRAISSLLVDIHSQNQQLKLADRDFRFSVLDGFAGLAPQLKSYGELYDRYTAAQRQLEARIKESEEMEKEREYLEFQYSKLEEAHLMSGELERLEIEQAQLANSESIKENLSRAEQIFESGDLPLDSALKEIENSLSKVAQFVPKASALAERIESSRIELKDIASDVSSIGESIAVSPDRLEEVDQRLAQLYDLLRRHSLESVDELIVLRDEIGTRLGIGLDAQNEIETLKKKCAELEQECSAAADSLSALRSQAAPKLSAALQDSVRGLEMPLARFEVAVQRKEEFGRDGRDEVAFMFDANGGALKELQKCASGGELSRIMLCIKALMCEHVGMPTMFFDEIDTGVSGSIADKMGRMIVRMSSSMQLFAITHLPQVASKGTAHYLVFKEGKVPQTKIRQIEGEERVREIARMLSGSSVSDEALANARVLLKEN